MFKELTENRRVTINAECSIVHKMIMPVEKRRILTEKAFVEMKLSSDLVSGHSVTGLMEKNILNQIDHRTLVLVE